MEKRIVTLILLCLFIFPLFAESERIVILGDGTYVSTCRDSLVQRSFDGGITWNPFPDGLPEKHIYPFKIKEYRDLSSIFCHEASGYMVACGSNFVSLYDVDTSIWKDIPTGEPIKVRSYFTSVAMKGTVEGYTVMIGTSCDGLFVTYDMGATWEIFPSNRFYIGGGFYEEITAICPVDNKEPYTWYASSLPDNQLYGYDPYIQRWKPLPTPKEVAANPIHAITDTGTALKVFTGTEVYEASYDGSEWYKYDGLELPVKRTTMTFSEATRKKAASDRTGIYLNYINGKPGRIENHIKFLKAHNMDSFVIDLKDDFGNVTCTTSNPVAAATGANKEYFDLAQLLETAHSAGMYVIGRIVVFKDERMYRYDGYKYAVKKKTDGKPWENGREYWVDPFCSDIWDYNISLALEFQEAGVDEIQFDYIRFPTDGKIQNIEYTWQHDSMTNSDALESFLKKAREAISIPISVDFYGFNGWNKMEKWNGQNLVMASKYVDVVSPMYYPSHFSTDFHKKGRNYMEWAEYIYEAGTLHSKLIGGYNNCLVRPFVQAFLVGDEKAFSESEYFEYYRRQIDGLTKEKASGCTLWNSSNKYYMVPSSFRASSKGRP